MVNIKGALRTAQAAQTLTTVSITDVATEVQAVDVRMAHHNATGNDYVHFVAADGQYLSIKVSPKCELSGTVEQKLKSLINNFLIYTGEGDNGTWFTFGPAPSQQETVTVSMASLLGKQKVNA